MNIWYVFLTFVDRQQCHKMCILNHSTLVKSDLDFDEKDLIERTPLIDFITIKEIFRYTLSWKNPEIQKLILDKIDDVQYPGLLSGENLDKCRSIIIDMLEVDDVAITKTVLSAVTNQAIFLFYGSGYTLYGPLLYALQYTKGQNMFHLLTEAITVRLCPLYNLLSCFQIKARKCTKLRNCVSFPIGPGH